MAAYVTSAIAVVVILMRKLRPVISANITTWVAGAIVFVSGNVSFLAALIAIGIAYVIINMPLYRAHRSAKVTFIIATTIIFVATNGALFSTKVAHAITGIIINVAASFYNIAANVAIHVAGTIIRMLLLCDAPYTAFVTILVAGMAIGVTSLLIYVTAIVAIDVTAVLIAVRGIAYVARCATGIAYSVASAVKFMIIRAQESAHVTFSVAYAIVCMRITGTRNSAIKAIFTARFTIAMLHLSSLAAHLAYR